MDGHKLKHNMLCTPLQTRSKDGVRTGLDVEQPFQFADLKTTGASQLPSVLS